MKVASYNGCKVYNLSSGKTIPAWLSANKRRALAKDEEYSKRLELIQDFEMTTAAQCITMTKDSQHIIVTGTYPPVVKCFTTTDLSLKFQRGLTCEVVAMESLSDDFGKMVFLQSDRTLNFHAPYGTHYSVRVPKFGRHMVYNWENCDLYVAGSGNEVYRLNLEAGQFKEPFQLQFEGCNKVQINPVHQFVGCGGDGGICEFWDPRSRKSVSKFFVSGVNDSDDLPNITAMKFESDGLTLALGTSDGNCLLYDIRSKNPIYTKEHQYGLPIIDISFHKTSRSIISTDKKLVKIWERDQPNMGKIITNIEASADINSVLIAKDNRGDTGLLMLAGEQSRVMSYFVPQLGPAPRWCSFLEGLTEELEETAGQTVYEDFKFVTKQELEELGATSLIGTNVLKAYMHGFFMDTKLYNKLRAVSKPFEYEQYRKQKINEKIEAKRQSRIAVTKKLPKVNAQLAQKLMKKTASEDGNMPNIDSRFSAIFERPEFQQDENSAEYLLHHPNSKNKTSRQQRHGDDSDDDLDIYEEVGEDDASDDHDDYDDKSEIAESHIEEDDDDDDDLVSRRKKRKNNHNYTEKEEIGAIERATLKAKAKLNGKAKSNGLKMYEISDGANANDAMFSYSNEKKQKRKQVRNAANIPLAERIHSAKGRK